MSQVMPLKTPDPFRKGWEWLVLLVGLHLSLSRKRHPSQREEESGCTTTFELSPWQSVAVTNETHGLIPECCHGEANMSHVHSVEQLSASYYLTLLNIAFLNHYSIAA